MNLMSTALVTTLHWTKGDDGDLVAITDDHELIAYPPSPTGRAFWFITTRDGSEIASGFADTLADAKTDAAHAAREDLPLWAL